MPVPISPEEERRRRGIAVRMYKAGSPITIICRTIHTRQETVRRWLAKQGLRGRGRPPAGGSWEYQRQVAAECRSPEEFHRRVGKSPLPILTTYEKRNGIVIGGGE